MYYQTHFTKMGNNEETENLLDPLPLVGQITHLMLGAFHLNEGKPEAEKVTLNNHVPHDDYLKKLWPAITGMQEKGVKVLGMLGGAANGTYPMLTDDKWDDYYPALKKVITDHKLDGMDLDVEQATSLQTIERIIETLKKDFGDKFIITLTPVASALSGGSNLSGFSYLDLEKGKMKDKISFYNAQFYSGFGTFTLDEYGKAAGSGIDASRITATLLTSPRHGQGFVAVDKVKSVIQELMGKYGTKWGGVGGWEYFGATDWAKDMHETIQKGAEKRQVGKGDALQGRSGMRRVRFSRERD